MNIEDTVEECALDIFDGRGVEAVIRSALIKQESELKLQRDELLDALELAIDTDGGTTYSSEDDEVGERSCCGAVSYKPHRQDCWVVKARAAIAKAKGEAK